MAFWKHDKVSLFNMAMSVLLIHRGVLHCHLLCYRYKTRIPPTPGLQETYRGGSTHALLSRITNVYHAIVYDDDAASSKENRVIQERRNGPLPIYPAINTQSRKNTIWRERQSGLCARERTQRLTYQYAKHLGYQPTVTRDTGPVLEQLFLRPFDVVHHVFSVNS